MRFSWVRDSPLFQEFHLRCEATDVHQGKRGQSYQLNISDYQTTVFDHWANQEQFDHPSSPSAPQSPPPSGEQPGIDSLLPGSTVIPLSLAFVATRFRRRETGSRKEK